MTWLGISDAELVELVTPVVAIHGTAEPDPVAARHSYAAAAWSAVLEPGDRIGGLVRDSIGAERGLELLVREAGPDTWASLLDRSVEVQMAELVSAIERWRPRANRRRIEIALQQAARWKLRLIDRSNEHWPAAVDDLGDHAPAALWIRGEADALAQLPRSVALVGSRASTGYGEHVTMDAVADLVEHGFAIVSGAAYGIDACAHRTTLATNGTTLAVMAGGLDRLYPQGNAAMLEHVAQTGLLIAELPCGEPPTRWRFLARNRLIAALSGATVVVEASARSGSINTAGHAATMGRPLGAVPGPVTSGSSAGCHRLIREYGAELVQSGADMRALVVDDVGEESTTLRTDPSSSETRVLDAMSSRTPRDEHDIALRSGLSPAEVRSALGLLTVLRHVYEHPKGWLRATRQ